MTIDSIVRRQKVVDAALECLARGTVTETSVQEALRKEGYSYRETDRLIQAVKDGTLKAKVKP